MRAIVTDPAAPGGLRLADDFPEPERAPNEFILGVRAFSVNSGELALVKAPASTDHRFHGRCRTSRRTTRGCLGSSGHGAGERPRSGA